MTACGMCIRDWSSDVCSSELHPRLAERKQAPAMRLLDGDATVHNRTVGEHDIAVDGFERAGDRVVETNTAIDGFQCGTRARTTGQGDAAVHRLHTARDHHEIGRAHV